MRRMILTLTILVASVAAHAGIGLTPRPRLLQQGEGELPLPHGMVIGCGQLPDSIVAEAARFASWINACTDLEARALDTDDGVVRLHMNGTLPAEGYALSISPEGAEVEASGAAGFFYAFQTLKMLLPPNVAARVHRHGPYQLPVCRIEDEPRFAYRGFMLDVSRHFFTVEQVKRMVDVMALYKMNRFHWHLTDDQGWRAQIAKYPRLTEGQRHYTRAEMAEVVEYCRQRHIEVIPEVDMPGHFVAAMVAYPHLSCDPLAPRALWTTGGVSRDVLNVAHPGALPFVTDIIDELCEVFPAPWFHIGGDECPTEAWEGNDQCRAMVQELGLGSYRELQSRFINQVCAHLATRGKRAIMWNECVTARGADVSLVAEYSPVIMSWHPCQAGAARAAELGLDNIVTEYRSVKDGLASTYYINRKQSADPGEPPAAGSGDDTVEGCYRYVPVPADVPADRLRHYTGVQGTFWTEWVSEPWVLEYLALPRLMAVAEAGWTAEEQKDYADWVQRMARDRAWLDMAGYSYGKHIWQ